MSEKNLDKIKTLSQPKASYYDKNAKRTIAIDRQIHYKLKSFALKEKGNINDIAEKAILFYLKENKHGN